MTSGTFELRYKCPVIVEVDLDRGEVSSVHVDDEAVKFDGLNAEEREIQARQIAEKASWPAWQHGF